MGDREKIQYKKRDRVLGTPIHEGGKNTVKQTFSLDSTVILLHTWTPYLLTTGEFVDGRTPNGHLSSLLRIVVEVYV